MVTHSNSNVLVLLVSLLVDALQSIRLIYFLIKRYGIKYTSVDAHVEST